MLNQQYIMGCYPSLEINGQKKLKPLWKLTKGRINNMLTYDRIDRDELIARATEYLQNYELQYQLSQKHPGTIGSPDSDGMPKGSKIDNPAESSIVDHISSQQYCDCIEQAIDNLRPEMKKLLYNKYINIDKRNNIPEWDKIGISKAAYYQDLKEAKYWFGITCSLVSIPLK